MISRCWWSKSKTRGQKSEVRGRNFGVIILAALVLGSVTPASATVLTAVMKTPYFTVHYSPSDRALAQSTADMAQRELVRISSDLGYTIEPGRPLPLKVYSSHYSFIKEGGIRDRFTVGTARTGDETISIDASGALVIVRQVLAHEITHAVIFRILGYQAGALPLWANEGLAKFESETNSTNDDTILAEAAADSNLMPLGDLAYSFPVKGSSLAYAESWSAIRYLVKEHGRSAPKVMLSKLARTGSFDGAMAKATGETEERFVKDWSGSLAHRFDVARLLRIAGAFLWPVMAILAVWAFIVRRRKMREAARQWDWDEFEESMERQLREWPHR